MGSNRQVLLQYRTMSPQDQATFRGWRLNTAVGSILVAGLVVMALVASNVDQSGTKIAASGTSAKVIAAH